MRRIRIPYEYGRLVPEQMKNGVKNLVSKNEILRSEPAN
mgnify:CR=1 FL=1